MVALGVIYTFIGLILSKIDLLDDLYGNFKPHFTSVTQSNRPGSRGLT